MKVGQFNMESMMERRDFLRQLAAWSAGLAAGPAVFELATGGVARGATDGAGTDGAGDGPVVAVIKDADHAKAVRTAIEKLGGIGAFVKSGDKVVVKPNMGWDRTVEQGANTHPVVVATLVRLALDAGAKQVLVFDRSCNDARRCYANSGIKAAVEAIGDARAQIPFIDDRKFAPVKILNGKAILEWALYRDAVEADCYINAPVAKHHGLSKLTLGMKNVMGVIGGNRGQIHQSIGQKLADLNTVIRAKLTVIDATRILLRHGPQGGNLEDVKVLDTVIASADPVAADAYATTLFGMKPEEIESTVAAHKAGLGEMDLAKMRIVEA